MVLGWTGFCAASFLISFAGLATSPGVLDRRGSMLVGTVAGVAFWALLWVVPLIVAEAVAIALSLAVGVAPAGKGVSLREWRIAFVAAFIPNALLALAIAAQILAFRTPWTR